jgi:hypothetical protein
MLLALNYSSLPGVRDGAFNYAEVLLLIDMDVLYHADPALHGWLNDMRLVAVLGDTISLEESWTANAAMYEALLQTIEAGCSCIKVVQKETLHLTASVSKIHDDLDRVHTESA